MESYKEPLQILARHRHFAGKRLDVRKSLHELLFFFVKTISYFLKEEIVNAWMRKLINRAKISYLELAFFVDCEVICRKDEVNFNFMSIFRVIHFFNHSWWIRRPARNARRCACLCNHHTIISRFGSRRPDFSTQRVFQWRYFFIDHLLHICQYVSISEHIFEIDEVARICWICMIFIYFMKKFTVRYD